MKQESKEDKIGRVKVLQVEIQELLGRIYGNQKSIIKLLDEINKANIPISNKIPDDMEIRI